MIGSSFDYLIWFIDYLIWFIDYLIWSIYYLIWSIDYLIWSINYLIWSIDYLIWSIDYWSDLLIILCQSIFSIISTCIISAYKLYNVVRCESITSIWKPHFIVYLKASPEFVRKKINEQNVRFSERTFLDWKFSFEFRPMWRMRVTFPTNSSELIRISWKINSLLQSKPNPKFSPLILTSTTLTMMRTLIS